MVKVVLDWFGFCLFMGDFIGVIGGGFLWDLDMEWNRECFWSLVGVVVVVEVFFLLRDKDL